MAAAVVIAVAILNRPVAAPPEPSDPAGAQLLEQACEMNGGVWVPDEDDPFSYGDCIQP